jgi:broad specificity phosphatase PhoE
VSTQTDEIALIRHGRSEYAPPTRRITPSEFRAWIEGYNRAGIAAESAPAEDIVAAVRNIDCVVCSDLARAVASADRLCPGRRARVSPQFREAGRPVGADWSIRLPLWVWDRISVLMWHIGWSVTDEPRVTARARARAAARELVALAREHQRVVCVGHGRFNAMVGAELRRMGWRGPRRTAGEHWGLSTYYGEDAEAPPN